MSGRPLNCRVSIAADGVTPLGSVHDFLKWLQVDKDGLRHDWNNWLRVDLKGQTKKMRLDQDASSPRKPLLEYYQFKGRTWYL